MSSRSDRFEVPPPYSDDGYLDKVTGDRLRDPRRLLFGPTAPFEQALAEIGKRPLAERLFLFRTLELRIAAFGERNSIKRQSNNTPPNLRSHAEKVIMEHVFGEKKTAGDKIYDKLCDLFTEFLNSGLNAKGKEILSFLQKYWSIVSAKTLAEVSKAVLAICDELGKSAAATWIKQNWRAVTTRLGRFAGAPGFVINRIEKRVIAICACFGRLSAFVGRLSPLAFTIDLLFTPEDIADDEKASIAMLLSQIQNARNEAISTVVVELSRAAWVKKIPTSAVIQRAIVEAR